MDMTRSVWRKIATTVAVLVTATAIGATAAAAPAAAAVYPHQIIHASSHLCLEVPSGSTSPNVQLWLNVCTGARNQRFDFVDAGLNWRYFIQPAGTGLCLTPGVAALDNSTIVQWYCDWSSPQVWLLAAASSDNILVDVYSGMCLGVDFAFPGAFVRQGASCKGTQKRWVIA